MDYCLIFGVIQILIFLGMFMTALYILLPKTISLYSRWKTTGRVTYLSAAGAAAVVAFFFLAADFVMFLKIFINGGLPCIK